MLNSRTFLVVCLVIFIAFSTNFLLDQSSEFKPEQTMARNDPDLYMVKPDITKFNETGERKHKIRADRLTHYPLTDITTLHIPLLTLYGSQTDATVSAAGASETGRAPWDIEAKNGRLLPKAQIRDEIVELWDNVVATKLNPTGKFVNIQTQALTVYPDRDYAETDKKVYIDNNTGRTIAGGMKAYFEKNRYILLSSSKQRVQTIFLPEFETEAE